MASNHNHQPNAAPGRVTRKYQQEMLEESLKRNIIIVLDTGSGKTHIAILRIRLQVERQLAIGSNKTCWFLVPTVALCAQQTAVFQEHLPYNIDSITGQKQPEKWTSPTLWHDIVSNNRVIVSTAQVLLDALRHAYVKLERDISLLIFDEAHHALKGHAYARIMREFFDDLPSEHRPHILGLTASPLNVGVLEQNLLCRALTTKENEDELKAYVYPPTFKHAVFILTRSSQPKTASLLSLEAVFQQLDIEKDPAVLNLRRRLENPALADATESERLTAALAKILRKKNTVTCESMSKLVQSANATFIELGPWATDRFIANSISKLIQPIDSAQEFSFFESKRTTDETRYLRTMLGDVAVQPPGPLAPENVSDQVSKLIEVLLEERAIADRHEEPFSCIIFVTLRSAALLLSEILNIHPSTRDTFRTGFLVGWSNDERRRNVLDLVVGAGSEQAQEKTLAQFRSGEINLMVATSVLEEGLDVPICGTVVRFNRPDNITSWVQSRGRARAKRSSFVVMFNDLENGSAIVREVVALEEKMNALYKSALRERAVGAPQREGILGHFRVQETGALLTLDNATSHISHFCDMMPHKEYAHTKPIYDIFPPDGFIDEIMPGAPLPPLKTTAPLFGCTLTLPNYIRREYREFQTPMIHTSEKAAKRQVAFEAYQKLFSAGLVNPNLLPWSPEEDPAVTTLNGPNQKRSAIQEVVAQKDAWELVDEDLAANEFWSCQIEVEDVGRVQMLTKIQPPLELAMMVLYEKETPHRAQVRVEGKIMLTDDELGQAQCVTRLLWWSTFGSHMSWDRTDFVHLFVLPRSDLEASWRPSQSVATLAVHIPEIIARHGLIEDLFIVRDSRNDTRAKYEWYQFRSWREEPLTEDQQKDVEKRYPHVPEDNPLLPPFIEAVKLRRQASYFTPDNGFNGQKAKVRILHPRFCKADILPPNLGRLSLFLPSILRDMQTTVLSRDIYQHLFDTDLLTRVHILDIRTAITTPLTGDVVNYQRVETLGDCVLKFLTSLQLLAAHPDWHEGYLSKAKDHIVSNLSLARESVKNELARWIIRDRMVARKWRPHLVNPVEPPPPKVGADGDVVMKEEPRPPTLSTKVLADVVESLIGAAHESGGYDAAVDVLQRLGIGSKMAVMWKSPLDSVSLIVNNIEPLPVGYPVDYVRTLERMVGHTFKHPSLLLEALTHANYTGDVHTVSYERLEFLGDSVLDNVVTEVVYKSPRRLPPVLMTRCRIATVNMEILAFCCANLTTIQEHQSVVGMNDDGIVEFTRTERVVHLPTFLRISNIAMLGVVRDYLAGVERARADIQHKLLQGAEYPWTELFALRAPKFLGDIVESIIGAIYLDTSGDMTACEHFIERLGILPIMRHLIEDKVDVRHPLTVLGEYAAKSQGKLKYRFATDEGGLTCNVLLNDELLVSLNGDNGGVRAREELKVRAAADAFLLIRRRLAATQT
ncbi:P-loop containing nucleoside triphosphate hydrolase protein [Auriculariales sp. MPI-PUGE-AT-0066]|nr:P-loop containing nucleoside triphosphate hydrolase protein [Auriculariales sp. MPI-PUGE-AT-0066]